MDSSFPSPEELKGAVQGTLLYLGLYFFFFVPFQFFSKFYVLAQKKKEAREKGGKPPSFRGTKYYNSKDMLALSGDRTVGNFLEFAILFLPLMWIHALFVDPTKSFTICCIYTVSRSYYPFVFGAPRLFGAVPLLALSTAPGYLICVYLFYQIAFKFALA